MKELSDMKRILQWLKLSGAVAFALLVLTTAGATAEKRIPGNPAPVRLEGAIKQKEMTAPGTPATGYAYIYFKTDGLLYIKDDAGTETCIADGAVWSISGTDMVPAVNDDDLLLDDGTTLGWGDGNPGTLDTLLQRAAAGVLALTGTSVGPGTLRVLEDSDNGTNYVELKVPASLAANWALTLPSAAPTRADLGLTATTGGVASWQPFYKVLYSATAASASHAGTTAAETTVMPASAEGTGDTDTAAWLLAGAKLHWFCDVPLTGDADGDETLTVNVYLGGQLIGSSGAVADDGPDEIHLEGDVTIRTAGATGTGFYSYRAFHNAAFLAGDMAAIGSTDFTAVTPFVVKLDFGGTTDAADTATVQDAFLSVVNFD